MSDIANKRYAWAAGLFEGEGCIVTSGRSRRIELGSCDEDVVRRFHEVVGVGTIYHEHRENPAHRDLWKWSCSRYSDLAPLLAAFLPYLGDRRSQRVREMLANPPMRRAYR